MLVRIPLRLVKKTVLAMLNQNKVPWAVLLSHLQISNKLQNLYFQTVFANYSLEIDS